jgi:RimJ/RimL family protein N-acetyltransferase
MREPMLETERLELHHISAEGIISLFEEKSDLIAIDGRGLLNPYGVLSEDEGPLAWRVPQVKNDPSTNKWFLRFIVYKENKEIIGSLSFHGIPDENGMIEIGLGLVEKYRGQGLAQEALTAIWTWVCTQPAVKILRYTVSPTNAPSVAIIKKFDFTHVGQQMDEIDGPEDIYEMSVEEFLAR